MKKKLTLTPFKHKVFEINKFTSGMDNTIDESVRDISKGEYVYNFNFDSGVLKDAEGVDSKENIR